MRKKFLTNYGFFSTIIVTVVGVGIFSYPRELAAKVGTDGWIVTIAIGIVSYILLKAIWKVIEINEFKEFTLMMKDNFGRTFGGIMMLIFAAGIILGISSGMRTFVEVIKMNLLEKTPTEFILIITILTGVYLVRGEFNSIVMFNEICLVIMFVPMVIVLLFITNIADFSNIFPILHNPIENYIKSLKYTAFSFGGIELAFLLIPMLKDRIKGAKTIKKSIAFITVFYAIITIMALAVFSKEQVSQLMWPSMAMVKAINIPGTFIERWEGVIMALWIVFFMTTFVNGYYFSSHIVKEVFCLGDVKISSLILIPFIYIVAMLPHNIAEVYHVNVDLLPWSSVFNLIGLPLLLFFTARIGLGRRRGEVK